jgi:hypothetical protein
VATGDLNVATAIYEVLSNEGLSNGLLSIFFIQQQHFFECDVIFRHPLNQACQTGGPRAACSPIACPMRPAAILLDLKITLIN